MKKFLEKLINYNRNSRGRDIMNNNSKRIINKILSKKEINVEEYELLHRLISEYKETNPEYYNYMMGKALMNEKKYTKAKEHLNKVIEKNPNHKSVYYQMYKINVYKEEYEEALNNLQKYKELNKDIIINNDLVESMLKYMIKIKDQYTAYENFDFQVDYSNYFSRVKINNKKLKEQYNKLIDAYNRKNLSEMKRISNSMEQTINETNYPIEIKTIDKLLNSILTKSTEYHHQIMTNDEFLQENLIKISRNILDNNIPPRKITKYINRIVDINHELAEKLLQLHIKNNATYLNPITMDTLTNKIKERILFLNLSDEKKEQYKELKTQAHKAYKRKNYHQAYECYCKVQSITNHPIFDYYRGKILYKLGMYNESKKRILKYLENGGEKASKALLYLMAVEVKFGNHKKANKLKDQINILNNDLNYDFTIALNNAYQINPLEMDFSKQRVSKKLKMTEEDFLLSKEKIKIEEYYNYDLDKKLEVIKDLLKRGHSKEANKLLNELRPETKKEQIKVKQFIKNKKLYQNQK